MISVGRTLKNPSSPIIYRPTASPYKSGASLYFTLAESRRAMVLTRISAVGPTICTAATGGCAVFVVVTCTNRQNSRGARMDRPAP